MSQNFFQNDSIEVLKDELNELDTLSEMGHLPEDEVNRYDEIKEELRKRQATRHEV